MIGVFSKSNKKSFGDIFLKVVLFAGLLAFLMYGLSFFFSRPTGETITTHAPAFNANNNEMREVDYQSHGKKNKR